MNDCYKDDELYKDLVEEIRLKPEDLDSIKKGLYPDGREFPIKLKERCIFREVSSEDYELIPNALRKEWKI